MTERQLLDCLHESSVAHTTAPSAERRMTAAEVDAWWRANRDRWRTERRLALDDAVPRVTLPPMREGNERQQQRERGRGNG